MHLSWIVVIDFLRSVNWEDVKTAAQIGAALAVLIGTAIALNQFRLGAAQLNQVRAATQLDGTMKIFEMLGAEEQLASRRFIETELESKLKDPAFRAGVPDARLKPAVHLELATLRLMEMLGLYVKYGLLEDKLVLDYWFPGIIDMWERLDEYGVIAQHRTATGPVQWENFEELYRRAKRWQLLHAPAWVSRSAAAAAPEPPAAADPAGTKS